MKQNKHGIWFSSLIAVIIWLSIGNGVNAQDRPLSPKKDQELSRNVAHITGGDTNTGTSDVKLKTALPPSPQRVNTAAGKSLVNASADQHVFFIGTDKRVYNFWWTGSKWQLDALDYNAPAIAVGNLAVNSTADHVFFIGTDKRVYNFWWTGSKWQLDALDYNAPAIAAGNLVVK